jgi:hypothetical protein
LRSTTTTAAPHGTTTTLSILFYFRTLYIQQAVFAY